MDNKIPRIFAGIIMLICVMGFLFGILSEVSYAADPTERTKQEIINHLKNNNINIKDKVTFAIQPVKYSQKGELSQASKNSALKTLNAVRYIAGLSQVSIDQTYGNKAQAGAFVDWCISNLTHHPKEDGTKPSGMPDSIWNDGEEGASNSNISIGSQTLNDAIVNGWMDDSGSSNVTRVGHRMWCLNPAMSKTGFGATPDTPYYVMWSKDASGSGSQKNVIWPAKKMPVEFFGENTPWSLATGDITIDNGNNVRVTLKRRNTSPSGPAQWSFSGQNSYTADYQGLYFNFQKNNPYEGYRGLPGAYIIFRPDNVTYRPGDIFDVTITGLGSSTRSYTVEFFSGFPVESISFDKNEYRLEDSWDYITPRIQPGTASGYEVTYTSSNTSVATVDNNGKVTKVAPGTTRITATVNGRCTADGYSKSASYTLKVPKSISSTDISITQSGTPEYTGSAVDPFTLKDGNYLMVRGKDYEIEFEKDYNEAYPLFDDIPIEPGEVYFPRFKGLGEYYGMTNIDVANRHLFTIKKKSITPDMIELRSPSSEYNGTLQKPDVTVRNGNIVLSEGKDYTLTNNGGINAGKYTVGVKASGNSPHYTSNSSVEFTITPRSIDLCDLSVEGSHTYTGSPLSAPVRIRDGGRTLVKDEDYTLEYFNNTDAGEASVKISGKGNYKSDITGYFTIKQKSITENMITISRRNFEYNGKIQKPEISVMDGNMEVTCNIEIAEGKNAGTYDIKVTGKGNYKDTVNSSYEITAKQLTASMMTLDPDRFIYNGAIRKPKVTVRLGDMTLTEGTDYIAEIPDGKYAGSHIITISAVKGSNFISQASKDYIIDKFPLKDALVTIDRDRFEYDGREKKPDVTVKIGDINVDDGYIVTYTNNIDAGEAKATITATSDGNLTGKKDLSFGIFKDISHDTITLNSIPVQGIKNGDVCEPTPVLNDGSKALRAGTDYTLTYSQNNKEGKGKVSITGKGFYTGSRDEYFEIVSAEKLDAQNKLEAYIITIRGHNTTGYPIDDRQAIEKAISDAEELLNRPISEVKTEDYELALSNITEAKTTADRNLAEKIRIEAEKKKQEAGPAVAPKDLGPNTPDANKPNAGSIGKTITSQKGDKDPRGSTYAHLQLKSTKQTKKTNTIKWKRVPGATSYVIYGNKCGGSKFKRLTTIRGTSYTHKRLKKGTYYKYIVVAVKGNRATAISKVVHVATKGKKKVKNYTKIKITDPKKSKVTIKRGKTVKIKASQVGKYVKKHRQICFESANPKIATVTSKGKVKAVNAGKTRIFVFTQNGLSKSVIISVR